MSEIIKLARTLEDAMCESVPETTRRLICLHARIPISLDDFDRMPGECLDRRCRV